MLVIAALCVAVAVGAAADLREEDFARFCSQYDRAYSENEYSHRLAVFSQNLVEIDALNAAQDTAVYGVNEFSDLTAAEFVGTFAAHWADTHARMLAVRQSETPLWKSDALATVPVAFDWRNESKVTPVKNQKDCGGCWAFSATENIESVHAIATGALHKLAPQQLIDCVYTPPSGCEGGDTAQAFKYVLRAPGLEPEKDYPFTAKDGSCVFNASLVAAKISNWTYVTKNQNETEMLLAVYSMAPLSICVDAASWMHYKSGIITSHCGDQIGHCVQLTGFATDDSSGIEYWNIRNSWGKDWGEEGYIRVERNKNLCGLADYPSTAIVDSDAS
eukprot:m.328096 g.328096  ORF g.328096 m.328096 type:complete len:332 (-) comp55589_c0_seq1:85-1080(-)